MDFNRLNRHVRDPLIGFDPVRHVYSFGDECYESVTTVVDECFDRFDALAWARRKRPDDPQSLMDEWEAKAKAARDLGTLMHDRIERHYLGLAPDPQAQDDATFARFLGFAASRPLQPYRTEWRIFSERYKIAGTLDFLARDADGTFTIYDWKRSAKVVDPSGNVMDNSFRRTAHYPLSFLPDTTYNHYALQVSIYRFILREHYGIDVSEAFLGVFHPDLPTHFCVRLPYLYDEVRTLLEYRLK